MMDLEFCALHDWLVDLSCVTRLNGLSAFADIKRLSRRKKKYVYTAADISGEIEALELRVGRRQVGSSTHTHADNLTYGITHSTRVRIRGVVQRPLVALLLWMLRRLSRLALFRLSLAQESDKDEFAWALLDCRVLPEGGRARPN